MVGLADLLSVKLLIGVGGVVSMLGGFLVTLWYISLDRQSQQYDEQLRETIQDDPAFSGIQTAVRRRFVVTSSSRISKATTQLQQARGIISDKPYKILAVEGDTPTRRNIEMVRERCREIPGKNILSPKLVAAIRNHYSYRLAISHEDVGSDVIEHFKTKFESYEHASRVSELGDPSNYGDVVLDGFEDSGENDPLNDVFLPIVRKAERHRVGRAATVNEKEDEIDYCQSKLMLLFFGLYAESVKGAEVNFGAPEDAYLDAYRAYIRQGDEWGYWLLTNGDCNEDEFAQVRHMCYRVNQFVDEHWDDEYWTFHPQTDTLPDMEYVEEPFFLVQKEEETFRGGSAGSAS